MKSEKSLVAYQVWRCDCCREICTTSDEMRQHLIESHRYHSLEIFGQIIFAVGKPVFVVTEGVKL